MSDPTRKTDPEQLRQRPVPMVPRRQLPTRDDPELVRREELREELRAYELRLAQLREAEQAARKVEVAEVDEKPASRAAFSLQIRDWDKAIKFVVAITALVSLVLGIKNSADKAPNPAVDRVDQKVENVKEAVATPSGVDLKEVVRLQGTRIAELERLRCAEQRWWKEVLKHQQPPVVVDVVGCENVASDPVEIDEGPSMPNGRRRQVVVTTPMPSAAPR